jgi:signal transduction histidine kinase
MRERAGLVGATLLITSAPQAGTEVYLDIPLPLDAPLHAEGT